MPKRCNSSAGIKHQGQRDSISIRLNQVHGDKRNLYSRPDVRLHLIEADDMLKRLIWHKPLSR